VAFSFFGIRLSLIVLIYQLREIYFVFLSARPETPPLIVDFLSRGSRPLTPLLLVRRNTTWKEIFGGTGNSMTQTLQVGEPGKDLKLADTIRATKL